MSIHNVNLLISTYTMQQRIQIPCQASKIEISVKIVNSFQRLYNALYLVK